MGRERYVAPNILSHRLITFETEASGVCDDNGGGDDKNGKDPDNGIGYCETANPKD